MHRTKIYVLWVVPPMSHPKQIEPKHIEPRILGLLIRASKRQRDRHRVLSSCPTTRRKVNQSTKICCTTTRSMLLTSSSNSQPMKCLRTVETMFKIRRDRTFDGYHFENYPRLLQYLSLFLSRILNPPHDRLREQLQQPLPASHQRRLHPGRKS